MDHSAIEVRDLSVSYGSTPVLVDVQLTVPVGAGVCVIGENGIGKSTLLRCVASLQRADADEAVQKANDTPYGLGGAVFGKRNGLRIARRLRAGMVAVNSTLTFVGMGNLPFGGVGESGFGRIHGEDGLREFARAKSITVRRGPTVLPAMTFERTPAHLANIVKTLRILYGRK